MLNPVFHEFVAPHQALQTLPCDSVAMIEEKPVEEGEGHLRVLPRNVLHVLCTQHLGVADRVRLTGINRAFQELILETQTRLYVDEHTHLDTLITFPKLTELVVCGGLSAEKIAAFLKILPALPKLQNLEIVDMHDLNLLAAVFDSTVNLKMIRHLDFSEVTRKLFEGTDAAAQNTLHEAFNGFTATLSSALQAKRLSGLQSLTFESDSPSTQAVTLAKLFLANLPSTVVALNFGAVVLDAQMAQDLARAFRQGKFQGLKTLDLCNGCDSSALHLLNAALLDDVILAIAQQPPPSLENLGLSTHLCRNSLCFKQLLKAFEKGHFKNLDTIKFNDYSEKSYLGEFGRSDPASFNILMQCLLHCTRLRKLDLAHQNMMPIPLDRLEAVLKKNPAIDEIDFSGWTIFDDRDRLSSIIDIFLKEEPNAVARSHHLKKMALPENTLLRPSLQNLEHSTELENSFQNPYEDAYPQKMITVFAAEKFSQLIDLKLEVGQWAPTSLNAFVDTITQTGHPTLEQLRLIDSEHLQLESLNRLIDALTEQKFPRLQCIELRHASTENLKCLKAALEKLAESGQTITSNLPPSSIEEVD